MNSEGCKLKNPKSSHLLDPFISFPKISTLKTKRMLNKKRIKPKENILFRLIWLNKSSTNRMTKIFINKKRRKLLTSIEVTEKIVREPIKIIIAKDRKITEFLRLNVIQ